MFKREQRLFEKLKPTSAQNLLVLIKKCSRVYKRSASVGGGGTRAPPNRNATNDKNITKKPCFFSFFFSIFA